MRAETVVLPGLVRADGSVEVSGKVGLAPGPVEVTLRVVAAPAPAAADWWGSLQQLRAEQARCRPTPPGVEEVDAEIGTLREEWEEHQQSLERLQERIGHAGKDSRPPSEIAE